MDRTGKIICISFTVVFVALAAVILRGRGSTYALIPFAVQVITYASMPRRSMLSFSLSHLPAIAILLWLLDKGLVWLIVAAACMLALASLRFFKRLPDSRPTTDRWLGSLILAEVLAVMIVLL